MMLGSRLKLILVMVMLIANSFNNTHKTNKWTNYSAFVLEGT